MIRTYLSIDLDYWSNAEAAKPFLSKVLQLDVPMVIVSEHHGLLPHIDRSGCRHLINVDYHDDVTSYSSGFTTIRGVRYPRYSLPDLNEGTWGTYVRWAHQGTFEWRYPNAEDCRRRMLGICDYETDVYTDENHPWLRITGKQGLQGVCLKDVRAVGFSVSLGYYQGQDLEELVKWVCGGRMPTWTLQGCTFCELTDLRALRQSGCLLVPQTSVQ